MSCQKLAAIVLPTALCTACVHTYTNDEIYRDADAYAADAFAPDKLTSASKQSVEQLHKPVANYKTLTVAVKAQLEGNGNFRPNPKGELKFTNMGDGLIREVSHYTNNDIPIRLAFSLNYLGLLPFRAQAVPYGAPRSKDINEVKSITSFARDAWKPIEGKTYEFTGMIGSEANIGGFATFQFSCTAGPSYPAKAFSRKLQGMATDFNCERRINNVITSKGVQTLWHDYGVAVTTSSQTSTVKETVTVVDVQID